MKSTVKVKKSEDVEKEGGIDDISSSMAARGSDPVYSRTTEFQNPSLSFHERSTVKVKKLETV